MRIVWKNLPLLVLLLGMMIAGFFVYERPADELEIKVCNGMPTREKVVAFTFDDGPHPITTALLLDILKRDQAKATFFVVGEKAEEYPELVRRIAAAGHQVGCHTYSHLNLTELTPGQVEKELTFWERDVDRIIGPGPRFLRPPGGDYDRETLSILRRRGYVLALWSVNPGDWRSPPPKKIEHYVLGHIHPGAVVLMHDDGLNTVKALPTILRELKRQGYRFVTMQEMARLQGVQ